LPAAISSPIELEPGNRALVGSAQSAPQVALVDSARANAWTTGNVEFDEATLEEVIRDVNRYTAKEFVIADPDLADIRLTGRFRLGDAESVKFALGHRFNIAATEDKDVIRLSRAR
jgi:transmembrane sensor